jgi:hypothetical protein
MDMDCFFAADNGSRDIETAGEYEQRQHPQ